MKTIPSEFMPYMTGRDFVTSFRTAYYALKWPNMHIAHILEFHSQKC